MNDYIFNTLLFIGLLCFVWLTVLANRHAKRAKFPKAWLAVLGVAVLTDSIVFNFRVLPLFSDWIWFSLLNTLAGIVLAVVLLINKKKRDLAIVLLMPVFTIIFARASNLVTAPQVEVARQTGDLLVERLLEFRDERGDWPESLIDLQAFDSLEIPESGVGLWGDRRYFYSRHSWDNEITLRFTGFVGVSHSRYSDTDWFRDD